MAYTREERCLANFNSFVGLPIEGFEGEVLDLAKRIRKGKHKENDKGGLALTKFDREMKKLDWFVKEEGGTIRIGLDRGKGVANTVIR